MKQFLTLSILLAALMIGVIPAAAQETQTPTEICDAATPAADPETRQFSAAEVVLEVGVDYQAVFCTELGPIYVDLYEDRTPATVNNFVFLAQQGFYNNSVFHRVITDFMIQGGDPVGDPPGTGGPGYQFADEFVGDLNFDRPGLLAMANSGPNTNGSQFFITTEITDWLNQQHTIFGEVLAGQNIAESIPDNQADPTLLTVLDTVVIITDPDSVEVVEFVPEPATREEVEAAFESLADGVSQTFVDTLTLDESASGVFDPADAVGMVSDDIQEDLQAYYDSHGLEYHAIASVANAECDLEAIPLARLNYIIDVYASDEDADAALEDEALADLQTAQDLELVTGTISEEYTFYSGVQTDCDRDDLLFIRAFKQFGRYVITTEIWIDRGAFQPEVEISDIADALIPQLSQPFEGSLLIEILRPEIR